MSAVLRSLVVLALLVSAARAHAAGKAGPARGKPDPEAALQAELLASCKADAETALCREVRRLCAARLVRDVVVPTCRALDWYGDDVVREVTHLCPLWIDHPRCKAIRAACVTGQAAILGPRGAEACKLAAWAVGDPLGGASVPEGNTPPVAPPQAPPEAPGAEGDGPSDDDELTEDEVEMVIDYCKGRDDDQRCRELKDACHLLDDKAGPLVTRTCRGLGYPMAGEGGAPASPSGQAPGGPPLDLTRGKTAIQNVADRPRPPRPVAGQWFLGPVAGVANEARAFGDSGGLVGGAIESTTFGIDLPLAGSFELILAGTGEGGFAYRTSLGIGVGGFLGGRVGLALVGGVGIDGVASGRVPMAVLVPARALVLVHLSPRLAALAWAQADWLFDDARQDGSETLPFADAAQAGAIVLVGSRRPANVPGPPGLGLGVIVLEQHDARAVLFVLGLGFAQEPYNK